MLSDQWIRIRSNVFDDRSWFARRAADLESSDALTFFLTMRPARALGVFVAFAGFVVLTGWAISARHVPEAVEVGWFIVILLGPMVVNAVLLVRHQSMLGGPA